MTKSKTQQGRWFESQCLKQLEESGHTIVTTNFQCKLGEIDLIALDGETLVFVEARYRKDSVIMHPTQSLTEAKKKHLNQTIEYFLLKHPQYRGLPIRLDFMAGTKEKYQWFQGVEF